MEVTILEEKKNKLFVDIADSPQIALEIIKKELWKSEHTKAVGTKVEHPLLNKQTFVLETDGVEPRKTIAVAIKKLQKTLSDVEESLKGIR